MRLFQAVGIAVIVGVGIDLLPEYLDIIIGSLAHILSLMVLMFLVQPYVVRNPPLLARGILTLLGLLQFPGALIFGTILATQWYRASRKLTTSTEIPLERA